METAEIGLGPGAEEDIGALSWDEKKKGKGKGNHQPRNNKCFNCGTEGHSIKNCRKPKNQCNECPSVAKDPFTTIRGMDFEQMQAYFWDKKDLAEKQGKGKAQ